MWQEYLRTCTRCGDAKPDIGYHKKGGRLASRCRLCISQQKAESYRRKKALENSTRQRRRNTRVLDVNSMTITDNWESLTRERKAEIAQMLVNLVVRGY